MAIETSLDEISSSTSNKSKLLIPSKTKLNVIRLPTVMQEIERRQRAHLRPLILARL